MTTERTSIRLLFVDDDGAFARMFAVLMTHSTELEPRICEDEDEATATLDGGFVPDAAVVADVLANGTSGVEFCRKLQQRLPQCKLFLVAAQVDEERDARAREAGIVDVLPKPCDFQMAIDGVLLAIRGGGGKKPISMTQYPVPSRGQIEHLRATVEQEPEEESMRQLLAFSLYMAQRYKEAAAEYDKLAEDGWCNYLTVYHAGNAYARMHRYEEAIERWTKAKDMAPKPDVVQKIEARIAQARALMKK